MKILKQIKSVLTFPFVIGGWLILWTMWPGQETPLRWYEKLWAYPLMGLALIVSALMSLWKKVTK